MKKTPLTELEAPQGVEGPPEKPVKKVRTKKAVAPALSPEEQAVEVRAQATLKANAPAKKARTPRGTPGEFAYRGGRGHMRVTVPSSRASDVVIHEMRQTPADTFIPLERARLTRTQWEAIAPTLQAEFNRQLGEDSQAQGSFRKVGETLLTGTTLGKELLVLAWATEDLPETEVSLARSGWLRLHPVERWWLYNQCLPVNGSPASRGQGWRAAIRLALTATPPVEEERGSDAPRPAPKRKLMRRRGGQDPLFAPAGD